MPRPKYFLLLITLSLLLLTPAMAADHAVVWGETLSVSSQLLSFTEEIDGVMLTEVPASSLGTLRLGNRVLRGGDALTAQQLSEITFQAGENLVGDAVISCLSICDGAVATSHETVIEVRSNENKAPVAENSSFQTYKNIPGQVPLSISDPEDDELTITVVTEPKRGMLEIVGKNIVYTPAENKVGKDSFTYFVTDAAGNQSEEATVDIQIEKPRHKETYADMEGDSALLQATWLREQEIFTGESLSGSLLFLPEATVSRGEFIAMCAALTGTEAESDLTVDFTDEIPQWLNDSVADAVKCGYISGIPTEEGLSLQAGAEITQAQAAQIVKQLLSLPVPETAEVMTEDSTIPAWAYGASQAVAEAGIFEVEDANAPLSRREAAILLYDVAMMSEESENSLLSWAKED